METLPLAVRAWTCPACGAIHDRDVNAAKNLERLARTTASSAGSNACGEEGSGRRRKTAVKPASVKQEVSFVPVRTGMSKSDGTDWDGSVLAIFPHDPQIDVDALAAALNDEVPWAELGFVCDGRFLFSQCSLERAPLPASFTRFLPGQCDDAA